MLIKPKPKKFYNYAPVWGKAAGGGGGGIVLTATDAQFNTFGFATSGSFTGVNFGTASSDRIVMIAVRPSSNLSTMTMTIGGVAATKAVADTTFNSAAIFYANVPTGATGTVAWTNTGAGINGFCIVAANISGQTGGGSATPSSTNVFASNMAQPIGPLSVTVPSGGIAFVAGAASNGATSPTFTWANTAATNGDRTIGDTSTTLQLGSTHMTTSSASVTVSSSSTMSFSGPAILSVSWAP